VSDTLCACGESYDDCQCCSYCGAPPHEECIESCREAAEELRRESDDERRAARGTSECDGSCDPMCNWCLLGHECPESCGGGSACPYTQAERGES
jgi:hypothetical protein